MTKALGIAAASLAVTVTGATAAAAGGACKAPRAGYPSFCDIPATPAHVRGAEAFRSAVQALRQAGRQVSRDTAPDTFGLPSGEAEGFDRSARAAAAPPPAITKAGADDTEAYAAESRRKAAPPPPRAPR